MLSFLNIPLLKEAEEVLKRLHMQGESTLTHDVNSTQIYGQNSYVDLYKELVRRGRVK